MQFFCIILHHITVTLLEKRSRVTDAVAAPVDDDDILLVDPAHAGPSWHFIFACCYEFLLHFVLRLVRCLLLLVLHALSMMLATLVPIWTPLRWKQTHVAKCIFSYFLVLVCLSLSVLHRVATQQHSVPSRHFAARNMPYTHKQPAACSPKIFWRRSVACAAPWLYILVCVYLATWR